MSYRKVTVRERAQKCKRIRERLIAYVVRHACGGWLLGCEIAAAVGAELAADMLHTTGEVLMKELRAACRAGYLIKSRSAEGLVQYKPDTAGLARLAAAPFGDGCRSARPVEKQEALGDWDAPPGHWQRG